MGLAGHHHQHLLTQYRCGGHGAEKQELNNWNEGQIILKPTASKTEIVRSSESPYTILHFQILNFIVSEFWGQSWIHISVFTYEHVSLSKIFNLF
jgi:hypothetical protein